MPAVRGGAAKWRQRAQVAAPDYQTGIQNPRRSWKAAASAAADTWQRGVQEAVARGSFKAGIDNTPEDRWKTQALQLGATRYVQGVQASGDRYERQFAPYRQVIESISLPERGPKGDPSNIDRVRAIAQALHEAKRAKQGGS